MIITVIEREREVALDGLFHLIRSGSAKVSIQYESAHETLLLIEAKGWDL